MEENKSAIPTPKVEGNKDPKFVSSPRRSQIVVSETPKPPEKQKKVIKKNPVKKDRPVNSMELAYSVYCKPQTKEEKMVKPLSK